MCEVGRRKASEKGKDVVWAVYDKHKAGGARILAEVGDDGRTRAGQWRSGLPDFLSVLKAKVGVELRWISLGYDSSLKVNVTQARGYVECMYN